MLNSYTIETNDSKELVKKLILFLLWPFFAFLYSLYRPASKSSYCIYFLFGLIFSWSMVAKDHAGIDFLPIIERFNELPSFMSVDELFARFSSIINGEEYKMDIYNLLINWLVKQFSDNYHTLFLVASIPFLYFMLKSLSFVTSDKDRFDSSIYCYIILLLFVLPKDLFNVQNFRFATATWMSVYVCMQMFYEGKSRYVLLLLITPYIHTSFWILVLVVLAYIAVKKFRKLIVVLFYISIPFLFFNFDVVVNFITVDLLPENLQMWGNAHMSEEARAVHIEHVGSSGFFWVGEAFQFLKLFVYTMSAMIMLRSKELEQSDEDIKRMFYFFLLFLSVTQFVQTIPVLGTRFWGITRIFNVFLMFKILYPNRRYNYLFVLMFASCFWEIFVEASRHYIAVLEPDFFFFNSVYLLMKYWDIGCI